MQRHTALSLALILGAALDGRTTCAGISDYFAPGASAGSFTSLSAPEATTTQFCCQDGCGHGTMWENTALLFAADGWRTRADDDYPGNFGFRTGFNSGIGWWDSPIRMQLGVSIGGYDLDGRDGDIGADPFSNAAAETQLFTTFGFYKRSDVGQGDRWAWGLVIDLLYDNNFGEEAEDIFTRQARGYLGYALDEANEFGTWFAFRL